MPNMSKVVTEITGPLIHVLVDSHNIDGILCFGSYAAGLHDEQSDLDLFIFCDPELPPIGDRQRWYRDLPGVSEIQVDLQSPGWDTQWNPQMDKIKLGSTEIDICFNTIGWLESVIDAVTSQGLTSVPEMTFRPYTMLGLLAQSIVLHDRNGRLQATIASIYPYPAKLKRTLIDENLTILADRLKEIQECVSRGIGNMAFLFHLCGACDSLLAVLLALNERYDSATNDPRGTSRS
jgi:predicted nucleotidyltransferase